MAARQRGRPTLAPTFGRKHSPSSTLVSKPAAMITAPADVGNAELLLRGATVIDGTGTPPQPATSLLIRGGRIEAVGPDAEFGERPDAGVFDARGLTMIPGLIDCHVHIGHSPDEMAPLYPRFGVTTVRDTGGNLAQ